MRLSTVRWVIFPKKSQTSFYIILLQAIIVSGGSPSCNSCSGGSNSCSSCSVEIIQENGSYWCSLPNLPFGRWWHSQSGLVTCGGGSTESRTSCVTFSNGQWRSSHTLQYLRYCHSTWSTKGGVVIMGGHSSDNTTEILNENGQSTPSFTLKHIIR